MWYEANFRERTRSSIPPMTFFRDLLLLDDCDVLELSRMF